MKLSVEDHLSFNKFSLKHGWSYNIGNTVSCTLCVNTFIITCRHENTHGFVLYNWSQIWPCRHPCIMDTLVVLRTKVDIFLSVPQVFILQQFYRDSYATQRIENTLVSIKTLDKLMKMWKGMPWMLIWVYYVLFYFNALIVSSREQNAPKSKIHLTGAYESTQRC